MSASAARVSAIPASIATASVAEPACHHSSAARPPIPASATARAEGSLPSADAAPATPHPAQRQVQVARGATAPPGRRQRPQLGPCAAGGISTLSACASQPATDHWRERDRHAQVHAARPSSSSSPTWIPTRCAAARPGSASLPRPTGGARCGGAAMAAAAASTTDTSAARPRKRPPRSSAERFRPRVADRLDPLSAAEIVTAPPR